MRFRFRLRGLMGLVAVAAVGLRWPAPAILFLTLLGGPIAGGWLGRKRGDEGVFAGSVIGGVASYAGMGLVAVMIPVALGGRPLSAVALASIGVVATAAVTGMLVGAGAGALFQSTFAPPRGRGAASSGSRGPDERN